MAARCRSDVLVKPTLFPSCLRAPLVPADSPVSLPYLMSSDFCPYFSNPNPDVNNAGFTNCIKSFKSLTV